MLEEIDLFLLNCHQSTIMLDTFRNDFNIHQHKMLCNNLIFPRLLPL